MKRGFEGDDRGKGGGKGPKRSNVALPCVIKFLAPEVVASAIIGKGGQKIAEIRRSCEAKIGLTEHEEFYPGTSCRVVTCQTQLPEQLNDLCCQMLGRIREVALQGAQDAAGTEDNMLVKILMPKAAVGGLIGRSGANIKQLREETGAKVSIDEPVYNNGPLANQQVTLQGAERGLESLLFEACKQTTQVNQEPWFNEWACEPGAVYGGDGGGGGSHKGGNHKGGSHKGHGRGHSDRMDHKREDRVERHGSSRDTGPREREERRASDRHSSGHGHAGHGGRRPASTALLTDIAQEMPGYVMQDERGFALSCVVPNRLVGGLIGRHGAGTKTVEGRTGTKIAIREIPGDPENRALNITGPLGNACGAYMLMMQRYLDAEQEMR